MRNADTGCAKRELAVAAQQVKKLSEAIKRRDQCVERLAKLSPVTLYQSADNADLEREARTLRLLRDRFAEWQKLGYIPSRIINPGYNTDQPIRERGWTHWHHLFTPRQLLVHGKLAEASGKRVSQAEPIVACLLGLGRTANWDSRLSQWDSGIGKELVNQVFYNQALNTLDSFAVKGVFEAHQRLVCASLLLVN